MSVAVFECAALSAFVRFRPLEVFIRGMEDQVRIGRGHMYPVGGAIKLFEPQAVIASRDDEMTPASEDGFHDVLAASRLPATVDELDMRIF